MSNGKLTDCGIQSGAVLWLRHSFARAFSWGFGGATLVALLLSLRASARTRGNQTSWTLDTFDCFALLTMTQGHVSASVATNRM